MACRCSLAWTAASCPSGANAVERWTITRTGPFAAFSRRAVERDGREVEGWGAVASAEPRAEAFAPKYKVVGSMRISGVAAPRTGAAAVRAMATTQQIRRGP